MWSVNDVSTVFLLLPPPLLDCAVRKCVGVCVYISVITLVKVQSVNWTVNIAGVSTNYHNA